MKLRFVTYIMLTLIIISTVFVAIPPSSAWQINFYADKTSGAAPLTVNFQLSVGTTYKNIDWSFGDGSAHVKNVLNPSHTYQNGGNFTGTVEVEGQDGTRQSQVFSISVSSGSAVFHAASPRGNQTTAYQILHGENGTSQTSTTPPFTVKTDTISYKQGDAVIITGHVRDIQNATAVTLRVFNDLKNIIGIAQLLPGADGSFTKTFLATGPLWKDAGNYTIVAQYGRYTQANSTFYYAGGNGLATLNPVVNGTYQLTTGGVTYNIPYIIKSGTVNSMNIYSDKFTLEVAINAQADGSLTVTLPRQLIDAKVPANLTKDQIMAGVKINPSELEDQSFIVTVNQKSVTQFTEVKNPTTRTISIPFHQGDTTIDIVGTIIVPEFGPIAALVLAIAIVSIIAVSAKTGLRFMPKY